MGEDQSLRTLCAWREVVGGAGGLGGAHPGLPSWRLCGARLLASRALCHACGEWREAQRSALSP